MRKMTRQEFESITRSEFSENPIVKEIQSLGIGEAIEITVEEWGRKTTLSAYFGQIRKRSKNGMEWKIRKVKNRESWAVLRTQ